MFAESLDNEVQELKDDTPSRAMNPPKPPRRSGKEVRTAENSGPATTVHRPAFGGSLARHSEYKHKVDSLPAPVSVEQTDKPFKASKVSAPPDTSEEEANAESPQMSDNMGTKRPYDELDYELAYLKTKKYTDLDHLPFLQDPRRPVTSPTVGPDGVPLTLSHRLDNVTKMNLADQATFFESLSDENNEEVGQWFTSHFEIALQKIMERRLERRKIALKYEAEVKRRDLLVQVKKGDVEDELAELRRGGGQLIEGRSVANVGGTPRKTS
jgi:Extracellular mutant protein 11